MYSHCEVIHSRNVGFSYLGPLGIQQSEVSSWGAGLYHIIGSITNIPRRYGLLKNMFWLPCIEGYGMTETSCLISCTLPRDNTIGHVGAPSPSCEVKLADVLEMEYTSYDKPYPRGEICTRGPILFKGYYKDEVQTREIFNEEGWLRTGDIGCWLPGGRLKIIDRKKNIFKLAQGEYIAPEKIENVYLHSHFISVFHTWCLSSINSNGTFFK